jgi:hypothetical protein
MTTIPVKREVLTLQRRGRIPPDAGITERRLRSTLINLPLAVHTSNNGRIIVHDPGGWDSVDGYGNKYTNLANFIQESDLAAMVRMDNFPRPNHPLEETLYDDLRFVIEYTIGNAESICGTSTPELYLMGFSGGCNALAVVAPEFPQIEKILMMGPAIECRNYPVIVKEFAKYKGELYIVQGEQDFVHGSGGGHLYYNWATNARKKEIVMIPGCEHFFRHETNDKIYSKAPFWAFAEDLTFPDPQGGVRLVRKS